MGIYYSQSSKSYVENDNDTIWRFLESNYQLASAYQYARWQVQYLLEERWKIKNKDYQMDNMWYWVWRRNPSEKLFAIRKRIKRAW